MTRPGFLTATAIGVAIGLGAARASGIALSPRLAAITLILALVAHAAANVINDFADALSGADDGNDTGIAPFTGGSRLIQTGATTVAQTGRLASVLLLVSVVGGATLAAALHAPGLGWIGAAGLVLAWAYSMPPLRLMGRGLGEPSVAMAWWLVVIGADYVQRGGFSTVPAIAGAGYALLIADLLLVNGLPDAASDARVDKRTLAVILGPRRAALLYAALAVIAHGWVAIAIGRGALPMIAAAALPTLLLSLTGAAMIFKCAAAPQKLRPAIVVTLIAAQAHGLILAMALWSTGR
ncbi:MAG: prenyltransferase [Lysobacter sp.]|nr:prenyltransferase [Lysobacter sp.]